MLIIYCVGNFLCVYFSWDKGTHENYLTLNISRFTVIHIRIWMKKMRTAPWTMVQLLYTHVTMIPGN